MSFIASLSAVFTHTRVGDGGEARGASDHPPRPGQGPLRASVQRRALCAAEIPGEGAGKLHQGITADILVALFLDIAGVAHTVNPDVVRVALHSFFFFRLR